MLDWLDDKANWSQTGGLCLALVQEPEINWVFMSFTICWLHMAFEKVLARQKCAENGVQLVGARASIFLCHRRVKSLIVMIFSKLKFYCTRNGKLYYDSSIFQNHILSNWFVCNRKSGNLNTWKSGNPFSRFTNKGPKHSVGIPVENGPRPKINKTWKMRNMEI